VNRVRRGAHLDYPFGVAGSGRVAGTEVDDHVRDLIHQVLFTRPGERVNRPDFGCGLLELVFRTNSELLAGATELLVRGALQRWLSDVVAVDDIRLVVEDARLVVEVSYTRLRDGWSGEAVFSPPTGVEP
jgi:uncharacterized protein